MIEAPASRALNGERGWRELEATLRPFIARRVRREVDVDDVVQEVLLRVQRALPSLRDEQRFGPWVYRVARSAIVDHLRASARHPLAAAEPPEEVVDSMDAFDARAVEQQVAAYATLFISLLPSPYREALTLTEIEGLTQREAADRLGISLSGMKSRVQRGRQKLRAALEDCCHIALDARRRVVAYEPREDGKLPDGCCDR